MTSQEKIIAYLCTDTAWLCLYMRIYSELWMSNWFMQAFQYHKELQIRVRGIKVTYQTPENPRKWLKPRNVSLQEKGERFQLQVLYWGLFKYWEGSHAGQQERQHGHSVGQHQAIFQKKRQHTVKAELPRSEWVHVELHSKVYERVAKEWIYTYWDQGRTYKTTFMVSDSPEGWYK